MTRESILDMIRRLLALGRSPNENEAAAAIAKAEKMMAEYNVSQAEAEETDEKTWQERVVWTGGGGTSDSVDWAAAICEEYFSVRCFHKKWRGGSQLVFFGRPCNLDVAEYVLNYLAEAFRDRWSRARGRFGYTRKHARGFYGGLAAGLAKKLAAQRKRPERASTTNALIVVDADLEKRFKAMGIAVARQSKIDWTAGQTGYDAGVQININPGIRSDPENRPLLAGLKG